MAIVNVDEGESLAISFFSILSADVILLIFVAVGIYIYLYRHFLKKRDYTTSEADFSNIFQNSVTGLSIIIAGFWGVFSFGLMKQVEQANYKLEQQRQSVEEKELLINNTEASIIDITTKVVDYDYEKVKNKDDKGLIIEVKIKNTGKNKLAFNLGDKALTVYDIDANGIFLKKNKELNPVVYSTIGSKSGKKEIESIPLKKFISLRSSERTLSYFVTVRKGSLYYITFKVKVDPEDGEKICGDDICHWFVSKYVFIE